MFRIVRKSRERLLEERYEAQLAERERVVQLLAEQVEYLRAQLHMPTATVGRAAMTPQTPPFDIPMADDVQFAAMNQPSDEEDELSAMLQANIISNEEYEVALERIKARRPEDIIE